MQHGFKSCLYKTLIPLSLLMTHNQMYNVLRLEYCCMIFHFWPQIADQVIILAATQKVVFVLKPICVKASDCRWCAGAASLAACPLTWKASASASHLVGAQTLWRPEEKINITHATLLVGWNLTLWSDFCETLRYKMLDNTMNMKKNMNKIMKGLLETVHTAAIPPWRGAPWQTMAWPELACVGSAASPPAPPPQPPPILHTESQLKHVHNS